MENKNIYPVYKSLDSFSIKGRGFAIVVEASNSVDMHKNDFIGLKAIIDGTLHIIKSVESNAIVRIKKGDKISLLVDDYTMPWTCPSCDMQIPVTEDVKGSCLNCGCEYEWDFDGDYDLDTVYIPHFKI